MSVGAADRLASVYGDLDEPEDKTSSPWWSFSTRHPPPEDQPNCGEVVSLLNDHLRKREAELNRVAQDRKNDLELQNIYIAQLESQIEDLEYENAKLSRAKRYPPVAVSPVGYKPAGTR